MFKNKMHVVEFYLIFSSRESERVEKRRGEILEVISFTGSVNLSEKSTQAPKLIFLLHV